MLNYTKDGDIPLRFSTTLGIQPICKLQNLQIPRLETGTATAFLHRMQTPGRILQTPMLVTVIFQGCEDLVNFKAFDVNCKEFSYIKLTYDN